MKIKVGQIRQDCKGMFVITKIGACADGDYICCIYSDGTTNMSFKEEIYYIETSELIAEYNGWLTALNSEEFKNNNCNF